MMGTEDARKCRVLWQNIFWIFHASVWLFYTKIITMHGHLNIKYKNICQKIGLSTFSTGPEYEGR